MRAASPPNKRQPAGRLRLAAGRPDAAPIYFGGFDTVAVPLVNRALRLDWRRDAVPAGRTTLGGMVVVVPAASPLRTIGELFEAARRQGPESVAYGTPGVATAQHLLGEMINLRAGIRLLHSPYRGGNLVVNDVVTGNLQAAILVNSTALPPIRQGALRNAVPLEAVARRALLTWLSQLDDR